MRTREAVPAIVVHPYLKETVGVSWDAEEYTAALSARPTSMNAEQERKLEKRFLPDYHDLLLTEPAIIHDNKGRILLWFLPRALTSQRRVCY